MWRGLLAQAVCLWDCAHPGAGVGRGTSHSGPFMLTAPGTPHLAAVYLPVPMEPRGGEMEVAHIPSLRAGPLGACTGN